MDCFFYWGGGGAWGPFFSFRRAHGPLLWHPRSNTAYKLHASTHLCTCTFTYICTHTHMHTHTHSRYKICFAHIQQECTLWILPQECTRLHNFLLLYFPPKVLGWSGARGGGTCPWTTITLETSLQHWFKASGLIQFFYLPHHMISWYTHVQM